MHNDSLVTIIHTIPAKLSYLLQVDHKICCTYRTKKNCYKHSLTVRYLTSNNLENMVIVPEGRRGGL